MLFDFILAPALPGHSEKRANHGLEKKVFCVIALSFAGQFNSDFLLAYLLRLFRTVMNFKIVFLAVLVTVLLACGVLLLFVHAMMTAPISK